MSNWFFAANPYAIKCADLYADGKCSTKTQTLDMALVNTTHLITGLIGMLAIVFIIYAGIQFALSNGNAKTVQTAKATLMYAIVGLIVSIAAYAIVTYIASSLK